MSDNKTIVKSSIVTVLGLLLEQEKGTARDQTLKVLNKESENRKNACSSCSYRKLVCKINTSFLGRYCVQDRVKEKAMNKFHKLRTTTLQAVWDSFAES